MNNKVVIGGNLKLNNVISGTPNTFIRAGGRGGISNAVKEALLNCFEHVAWIDDEGQIYYQALYDALYAKELVSISALFEQGQAVIYDDDTLDDLKQYLTVTATYDDGTTSIITTYELSGTLNPGASSIQVSYENKKAYFTANVTHRPGILTITNNLNGCTTSNSASSMSEGDSYTAIITADAYRTLTGASVSITMGGVDITSSAYSNGTINITEVTGSLVITITAVVLTLVSISAVYTQSGTVYNTDSLDSLKTDLVVTATYSDSSTDTVPSADYTLSGTLTVGTSTITVTYSGKTASFNVTVTDFYAVDYTKDALENVTWMDNYTYNKSNGNLTATSDEHCTEKFTVQDCSYAPICNDATSGYMAIFMWDEGNEFMGTYEVTGRTMTRLQLKQGYYYALKIYNNSGSFDSSNVTMLPVDNRASATEQFTVDLSEYTDYINAYNNGSLINGGVVGEVNLTQNIPSLAGAPYNINRISVFATLANLGLTSKSMMPWKNGLKLAFYVYQGDMYMYVSKYGITTLADLKEYITTDHVVLNVNY